MGLGEKGMLKTTGLKVFFIEIIYSTNLSAWPITAWIQGTKKTFQPPNETVRKTGLKDFERVWLSYFWAWVYWCRLYMKAKLSLWKFDLAFPDLT